MTATSSTPTYPERAIRTRRIGFRYPEGPARQHYVGGDLVMSHLVSVLSGMFPDGEAYFVRSVRHFADEINDPELKRQVNGFVGQEVTHGREHRELNEKLATMGYPTKRVETGTRVGLARNERIYSPEFNLAVTAALEHYTATLAEVLLGDDRAREILGTTQVREMLLWHALEESEHKSVAFDVFRAVGGTEKTRIRAMRHTHVAFVLSVTIHTLLSLAGDPAARHPIRLLRSFATIRHSPFLTKQVIRRLRDYNRPGFHPDDVGTTELLDAWREELFGGQGRLTAQLR